MAELTKEELALFFIEICVVNVIRGRYENIPLLTDEEKERRKIKMCKNLALQERLKKIKFERVFLPFLEMAEFVELLQPLLKNGKKINDENFKNWVTIDDCLRSIINSV